MFVNQSTEDELTTGYYPQDGATCHTSNASMREIENLLKTELSQKNLWPPRSPDLTPADFFLSGLLKGKVYKNTPRTIEQRHTPRDSSRQRRHFGKSIPEFGETHSSVLGCERRPVSASIMSRSYFASFPVCVYKLSSHYLNNIIFIDNSLGPLATESPCTINRCVSLLRCPLTAVLRTKQHGLLFSRRVLDGTRSPWLFVFPSSITQQGCSLRSFPSHSSLRSISLCFFQGIFTGEERLCSSQEDKLQRDGRQYIGRLVSTYCDSLSPALAVSARVSTYSIPLLRDCIESNPPVFLGEPNSQVSERTGTNIPQGFPPKVTPLSQQQLTSLTGCCKAPNSDVIVGGKTGLNSTFCSQIYHSLTFRHCASCILGQAFHYSPENAFYIFNQQIYFII